MAPERWKDVMSRGAAVLGSACAGIASVWSQIKDLRIILIVLAATTAVLIAVDPGNDVLRDLADEANSSVGAFWLKPIALRWSALLAFCAIAGLNAWYWSHLLYKSSHGDEPPWFRALRRALGVTPLASVVVALPVAVNWRLGEVYKGMGLFAVAAALLLLFFLTRQTIARVIERRLGDRLSRTSAKLGGTLAQGDMLFMKITTISACVIFLVLIIPSIRTSAAWAIGPAAMTFMAVSCIIPITSVLIWWTRSHGVPVIALGVTAFVVFSVVNDNHGVRSLPGDPHRPLNLAGALEKWEAHVGSDAAPLVIVAAAGGASRAAYWTGTVLRTLDEVTGDAFSKHTFAISSVSGGSLGAIGYAAWRAERDADKRACFTQAFLGEDYLSPVITGMLYPDLAQRFLPLPILPSRATYLEEAWERGWLAAMATCGIDKPGHNPMASDFLDIWKGMNAPGRVARWTPIVLANGTHVQTGRRIITAPIQITPDAFDDAIDFFAEFAAPVRASTAAHNSARFPLVSPAGTLNGRNGTKGHIVDGGYFENGGLETAYDIARTVRRLRPNRQIVIIEISNDDTRDPAQVARRAGGYEALSTAPVQKTWFSPPLNEVTAIVGGLYGTRSARGDLVAKRVSDAHGSGLSNTRYFHFPLEPICADGRPPRQGETCVDQRRVTMSWLVSMGSKFAMDVRLNTERHRIPAMVKELEFNDGLRQELERFLTAVVDQSGPARQKVTEFARLVAPTMASVSKPGGSFWEEAISGPLDFELQGTKPPQPRPVSNNRLAPVR